MSSDINIVKDEEYYFERAFEENIYLAFSFKQGGLLVSKRISDVIITVAYTIAAVSMFSLMVATAFVTKGTDIGICCEALHFAIFLPMEMTYRFFFFIKEKTIIHVCSVMGKGFYDYKNTLDKECLEMVDKTRKKALNNKNTVSRTFICVVLCASSCVASRPLLQYMMGEHLLGRPNDGIERLAVVPLWNPFGKGVYSTTFVFIVEYIIVYVTPGIVFSTTLFTACACEDLGAQLMILGHTLMTVSRRAESLDMPRKEAIQLCFKHSVRHHQILLKFAKTLENVIFIPGFVLFFGSSVMMCISGFIFVSDKVNLDSKIFFFLMLLCELTIIFILCYYGQYVQETSAAVREMVYASDWAIDPKTMKSYVLIIQMMTLRPITLNFGGFIIVSFETFSNILSTTFSYFNLMLAMN